MVRIRNTTIPFLLAIVLMDGCVSGSAGRADSRRPNTANSGDLVITVRVDKLERHYTVHVPPGYDGKTSMPIVIMLHGGGGTGKAAATETGWGAKADEAGFLAVFPDAMPPDPSETKPFQQKPATVERWLRAVLFVGSGTLFKNLIDIVLIKTWQIQGSQHQGI